MKKRIINRPVPPEVAKAFCVIAAAELTAYLPLPKLVITWKALIRWCALHAGMDQQLGTLTGRYRRHLVRVLYHGPQRQPLLGDYFDDLRLHAALALCADHLGWPS